MVVGKGSGLLNYGRENEKRSKNPEREIKEEENSESEDKSNSRKRSRERSRESSRGRKRSRESQGRSRESRGRSRESQGRSSERRRINREEEIRGMNSCSTFCTFLRFPTELILSFFFQLSFLFFFEEIKEIEVRVKEEKRMMKGVKKKIYKGKSAERK